MSQRPAEMHASQFVRDLIEREEWIKRSKRCGYKAERQLYFAYRDYRGIWTIGVGHKIEPGENFGGLDEARVYALYARDIARFEEAITKYVTVPLEQNEYDALICFAFNCGAESLRPGFHEPKKNTAIWYLNRGRRDLVHTCLLAWDTSQGEHDANLHARREREGKLFDTPYAAIVQQPGDSFAEEAQRAFGLATENLWAFTSEQTRDLEVNS